MGLDKIGFEDIKKAFEADKAKAKEDIRQALKDEQPDRVYVGDQNMQANARQTDEINLNNTFQRRYDAAKERLETLHFEPFGGTEKLAEAQADQEEIINSTKARWRAEEQGKENKQEKFRFSDSPTKQFNQVNARGFDQAQAKQARREALKKDWDRSNDDNSLDKGIDI